MNKSEKKEELSSLNKTLLDDFSIEELENRLETDPLAVGQFVQLTSSVDDLETMDGCCLFTHCNGNEER